MSTERSEKGDARRRLRNQVVLPEVEACEWPGCMRDALCSTGNAGGALVCRKHFEVTNGTRHENLSEYERGCIEQMVAMRDDRLRCEARTRIGERCRRKAALWRQVMGGDVIAVCEQHDGSGYPRPY